MTRDSGKWTKEDPNHDDEKRTIYSAADRPGALYRLWGVRAALPDQCGRGSCTCGDHCAPAGVYILRSLRDVLPHRRNRPAVHDCIRAESIEGINGLTQLPQAKAAFCVNPHNKEIF